MPNILFSLLCDKVRVEKILVSVPLSWVPMDAALAMAVGFVFLSPSLPVQSLYRQQQPLRLRHRRLPSSAIRLLNEKIMKCWDAGGTDSGRRGRVQEWKGGKERISHE